MVVREIEADVSLRKVGGVKEVRIRRGSKGAREKKLKANLGVREFKSLKIVPKSSHAGHAGVVALGRYKETSESVGSSAVGFNVFGMDKDGSRQGCEEEGDWVDEEEWLSNDEGVEEEEGADCEFTDCQGRATFGLRGGGARYCAVRYTGYLVWW
ncbi:unnamed protein product [Choristocarpus tenellus]